MNGVGGGGAGAAPPSAADKFRMELLMERLRTKAPQYKTLHDTSKAVRMTMLVRLFAPRLGYVFCIGSFVFSDEFAVFVVVFELCRHVGTVLVADVDIFFICRGP